MLDCLLGSLQSLFWCVLLLFFVVYCFALFMLQGITQEMQMASIDAGKADDINEFFGTVAASILTLAQSTTNGVDWRRVYEVLDGIVSYLHLVFVAFVMFFVIAAWNIVTSVFVDKALKPAQPDLETLTRDQRIKDIADGEELLALFAAADLDSSATISREAFVNLAVDDNFRSYLHVRGIDIKNAEVFFEMMRTLSDQQEEVELHILVGGLIRMKGFATSIDLQSLSFEMKRLACRQSDFMEENSKRLRSIEFALFKLLESPVRASPLSW